MSLASAALVSVLALLAPLLVRAARVPVPDIVVQILLGILLGPQVLGWARVDEPVLLLSLIGLAFLLFLAGLELRFDRMQGGALRTAVAGFVLSLGIALVVGGMLRAAGLVKSPVLIAIILAATSVGIVMPILKDSGQLQGELGQLVVAGGALGELVPLVLVSLLFGEHASEVWPQVTLFAAFLGLVLAAAALLAGLERWPWLSRALGVLQDTTAEIRVRAAVALLMGFAALAAGFGLEAILGTFLAGATVSLLDRDPAGTHREFPAKLQAIGFGFLVPYFFVSTGMSLDVAGFTHGVATLSRVPVFLGALLLVRAVPALVFYRRALSLRLVLAAGLLQATSLNLPIVGGAIGVDLHLIRPDNYVALVAAGLLSVIIFPAAAAMLARGQQEGGQREGDQQEGGQQEGGGGRRVLRPLPVSRRLPGDG